MGGSLNIKRHFSKVPIPKRNSSGKQQFHFICVHCQEEVSDHGERLYNHLFVKCKGCDVEVRKKYLNELPEEEVERYLDPAYRPGHAQNSSASSASDSLAEGTVSAMFAAQNDKQKEFEMDVCELFVSMGLAKNMLDNPRFREFMKKWTRRRVPTARQMGYRIQPSLFRQVTDHIRMQVQSAEAIVLATDAWSNLRNESVSNFVLYCPQPVFFSAVVNTEPIKNATYVASQIKAVIDDAGIQSKLVGVISDNAAVMKAAFNQLAPQLPGVVFVGCFAHALNLFFTDVFQKVTARPFLPQNASQSIDETDAVQDCDLAEDGGENADVEEGSDDDNVTTGTGRAIRWTSLRAGEYSLPELAFIAAKVTHFFKVHQYPRQALVKKMKEKKLTRFPQMPGKTRWGSLVRCIKLVWENQAAIREVVRYD